MTTTSQETTTKQDILQYLLQQGQATAQELAEQLEISPQATRRHLKDLAAEALIEHQAIQGGMGRPQHLYQLTSAGRDRFPSRYDKFAVSLLDALVESVGTDKVGSILQKQWQRKALEYQQRLGDGSLEQRVEKLVNLRRQEGYMAEWHSVETDGQQSLWYMITEHNCAISQIAESYPSVCGHELEMFALALQNCTVERTHWLVKGEHRCGYLVKAK